MTMREVAVVSKSSPVVVVGANDGQSGSGSGTIDLSSFDKSLGPLPVTVLLVFDHPIKDPVESIKKALSQSLAVGHYHPMAGRLTADGDGGVIACTGEGVSFVGASASCALDEHLPSLKDLALGYPGDWCRPEDPLVLMQVTEFSCGGFVVGVTWNHVMADGAGMAQFLRAVGELARGVPPSVVPVRSSSVLPCIPPSVVAAQRAMMAVASKEMASLDVTIPASVIARIKAEWEEGHGHEQPCTVFEAVTALLWLCRTRSVVVTTDEPDEAPAALVFPSNVRQLLGAEDGYYGNCLAAQLVQAAVASSDINDLVKLIKRAKGRKPDQGEETQQQPLVGWYDTLLVSSWRNLGFEAAEFGGGRPARVMWQQEQTVLPICVVCPPCEGKDDGVNVMSLCVRPEHADAFLAALHAASCT